ncbi:hypothetical protein V1515DRAFT_56713 [Lipomyces mesembrius]
MLCNHSFPLPAQGDEDNVTTLGPPTWVTIPAVFAIASANGIFAPFGLAPIPFDCFTFAEPRAEVDGLALLMNAASVCWPWSSSFCFVCNLVELSFDGAVDFVALAHLNDDDADVKLLDCENDVDADDCVDDRENKPDLAVSDVVFRKRESSVTFTFALVLNPPALVPTCRTGISAFELISKAIVCIASRPLINDAANCPSTAFPRPDPLYPPWAVIAAKVVTEPPDTVRCLLRD